MKLPRDMSGIELAERLVKYGYKVSRQTGSHLRLSTDLNGEHHITIPNHSSLKLGTLNAILKDVADHLELNKSDLIKEILNR